MASQNKTEPGKKKDSLTEARQQIRDRIAHVEEVKKQILQRHRIELVGKGVQAFKGNNIEGAVHAYKNYLKSVEEFKGVPSGGLMPGNFDPKADIQEILMLSGVYWELLKFYDRTESAELYVEFKMYMEKYILFTKGMSFQFMAAETLRKYIHGRRAKHVQDFARAYKQLANSKCFVATELVEFVEPDTIESLRNWRDQVLKKHPWGRKFVASYYRRGPQLAVRIGGWPRWSRIFLGKILSQSARLLSAQ